MMPGYCGICGQYYDEHGLDHLENCPGPDEGVVSGSLEDYQQQTGDTGLIQAPEGFTQEDVRKFKDRK